MELAQIVQILAALIGGGLAGGCLTITYNWFTDKRRTDAKERGTIGSLEAELRHSKLLCDHNAKLRQDTTAAFIRFPTIVAQDVTFEERHSYPRLESLQKDLEVYVLGLLHINQLIDLHHLLWNSPERASSVSDGAAGRREELCSQIADLCAGKKGLVEGDAGDPTLLPSLIDNTLNRIEKLIP